MCAEAEERVIVHVDPALLLMITSCRFSNVKSAVFVTGAQFLISNHVPALSSLINVFERKLPVPANAVTLIILVPKLPLTEAKTSTTAQAPLPVSHGADGAQARRHDGRFGRQQWHHRDGWYPGQQPGLDLEHQARCHEVQLLWLADPVYVVACWGVVGLS